MARRSKIVSIHSDLTQFSETELLTEYRECNQAAARAKELADKIMLELNNRASRLYLNSTQDTP